MAAALWAGRWFPELDIAAVDPGAYTLRVVGDVVQARRILGKVVGPSISERLAHWNETQRVPGDARRTGVLVALGAIPNQTVSRTFVRSACSDQ